MSDEKFVQPSFEIVPRSGRGTLLSEEILNIGRMRIANGESLDEVASDLAIYEVALLEQTGLEELKEKK